MTYDVTLPIATFQPSKAETHCEKGKNRGDSYSYMMALMMGDVLGSNAHETKAQKEEEKENFLKTAIETAMEDIHDFGQLETWLTQLQQNDHGYSPSMQAWIKNELSQIKNFKNSDESKSMIAAEASVKSDLVELKNDQATLDTYSSNITKYKNTIEMLESGSGAAEKAVKDTFEKEIKYLESKKVATHWYEPWTYAENAALDAAIGASRVAEGAALGALCVHEASLIVILYANLGVAEMRKALEKSKFNRDTKTLQKDKSLVAQGTNAQNNLVSRLENSGKTNAAVAQFKLRSDTREQSKIQDVENSFESLIGDLARSSALPSSRK